jgi:hypothetical protein
MTFGIGRREFITLLGAAAVGPLAARAQQPTKLPTIGFLGSGTPSAWSPWTAAFVQRLHELGWIEGRNIAIEYRWVEGRAERFAEIAAEFAKLNVIVTSGNPGRPGIAGGDEDDSHRLCNGRRSRQHRLGCQFGAARRSYGGSCHDRR